MPESLLFRLREQKMVIEESLSESQFMSRKYDQNRFSDRVLGLTIAPTIDCNFACVYCYEERHPGRMTVETEAAILSYVQTYLPGRRQFNVTWYGGEPLLCKETLYRLTESFLEVSRKEGTKYSAFMVTNGSLLTPDTVEKLAGYGHFSGIQITLDGSAAGHDEKRPTRGGKPTFQTIWEHLLYAAPRLPMVLRMNVDLRNPAECHRLLTQLAEAGMPQTGLRVYFAPIHPFGKGCRDIQEKEAVEISTIREFAEIEIALTEHALQLGFWRRRSLEGPWLAQCQSVSTHTLVVEPDGSLQRCWIEVGEQDRRVGHISEPLNLASDANMRWLRFDPTRSAPCQHCEVLPICFGGCPQRHIDGSPSEFACREIRYNAREMILLDYLGQHPEQVRPPTVFVDEEYLSLPTWESRSRSPQREQTSHAPAMRPDVPVAQLVRRRA